MAPNDSLGSLHCAQGGRRLDLIDVASQGNIMPANGAVSCLNDFVHGKSYCDNLACTESA